MGIEDLVPKTGIARVEKKIFKESLKILKIFQLIDAPTTLDSLLIPILPPWPKMPAADIGTSPSFSYHGHVPGTPFLGLPPILRTAGFMYRPSYNWNFHGSRANGD